ncbi:MAG: RHS repeat-associated core domain-containing protein [Anaerolineaceae bacterium]
MQFYYEDDLHLTKVKNGQGGQVGFEYSLQQFYDDVNDNERSLYVETGKNGNECSSTSYSISPWYVIEGEHVKCDPNTDPVSVQVGQESTGPGIAQRFIPEYLIKPGVRYRLAVNTRSVEGTTGVDFGIIDTSTNSEVQPIRLKNVGPEWVLADASLDMPATFNPNEIELRLECDDCRVNKYQLQMFHPYYAVTRKTTTDLITNQSTFETYTWDNMTMNTADTSQVVATYGLEAGVYYAKPLTELRGRAMVQARNEEGLTEVTWFHQDDAMKGRAYRNITMYCTFYDAMETFNADKWTKSAEGTFENGRIGNVDFDSALQTTSTTSNWSVSVQRKTASLTDNKMAFTHFRIGEATTQAELGFVSTAGQYIGVIFRPENGQLVGRLRYNITGQYVDGDVLISGGNVPVNKWFGLMILMDSTNGMMVRLWQLDRPTNAAEYTKSGFSNSTWAFRQRVNTGTVWLDAYTEGYLRSETVTKYGNQTLYDTIVDNGIPDIAGTSKLLSYKDLAIRWVYATEIIERLYDHTSKWDGTRQLLEYNSAQQNNQQFGNLTKQIFQNWNGSNYVNHHGIQTTYYPQTGTGKYLVNLPAWTKVIDCGGDACNFEILSNIVDETILIYDSNTSYAAAPTTGKLSIQRTLVDITQGSKRWSQASFGYDSKGNQNRITTYSQFAGTGSSPVGGGRTTTRVFDSTYSTYLISETNALGQVTTTDYNYALGLPVKVTEPNGAMTGAAYDSFGRTIAICAQWDWNGSACSQSNGTTLKINYTDYQTSNAPFNVLLTQRLDATRWMQTANYYNGFGQLLQQQKLNTPVNGTNAHVVTDAIYDKFGRVIRQTIPYTYSGSRVYQIQSATRAATVTTYTSYDRVQKITEPNQNEEARSYYLYTMSIHDAGGGNTQKTYNEWGWLTSVTPTGGTKLAYSYDVLGRVLSATQGTGSTTSTTTMAYNAAGQKISMVDADMGAWSYAYNGTGELTSQSDARSCTTNMNYDAVGRLVSKSYRGSGTCSSTAGVNYYYDGAAFTFLGTAYSGGTYGVGYLTGMVDGSGATRWGYDARGEKTSEIKHIYSNDNKISAEVFTSTWVYNSADLVKTQIYPDGEEVQFGYDNAGRPYSQSSVTRGTVHLKSVLYDEAGRMTTMRAGWNGTTGYVNTSWQYFGWTDLQDGGKLEERTSTFLDGTRMVQFGYDYDNNGNILAIQDSSDAANVELSVFGYDAVNRLITMGVSSNAGQVYAERYSYDALGRMATNTRTGQGALTYGYDTNHKHAVATAGSNTYGYDANGNQITRMVNNVTSTLTYDAENRLIEATLPSAESAKYWYDGNGVMVKGQIGLVETYYPVGQYQKSIANGVVTEQSYYEMAGMRLGMRTATGSEMPWEWLLSDQLGSVIGSTESGGPEMTTARYGAFGNIRASNGTSPTDYGYTGQREQEEIGLYYYNARWYDPSLARFVQADTIVPDPGNSQAFDRYAYVNNNPLKYTDPSGHRFDDGCSTAGCSYSAGDVVEDIAMNEALYCQAGYTMYCSYAQNHPAETVSSVVGGLVIASTIEQIAIDSATQWISQAIKPVINSSVTVAKEVLRDAIVACLMHSNCQRLLTINYSDRLTIQTDIFHNFPRVLDPIILQYGQKSVNYPFINFSIEGVIQHEDKIYQGIYQIGVVIDRWIPTVVHHFFNKY